MKSMISGSNEMTGVMPAQSRGLGDWQRWIPYAAVTWSLFYAALGVYWALGGGGYPYTAEAMSNPMSPLLGQIGLEVAWIVVMLIGIPAAVVGVAMLRGTESKALQTLLKISGVLIAAALLLFMTGLDLLVKLGYLPYGIISIFTGAARGQALRASWIQWATIYQLLCLVGGFLWLGATICYFRRSAGACLYCGRQESLAAWQRPANAAHWGRIAVYVAMVVPIFYAITRYIWALGISLGMSEVRFRPGQESGAWVSGALFLGNFCLVGAVLMLGLVQRWGEKFPGWMIGLAGRPVPIALAVVPASLASVLLIVGGIAIWSGLGRMIDVMASYGADTPEIIEEVIFALGPTLLFPVWGIALMVATLGYYYRRRGRCSVCGRG